MKGTTRRNWIVALIVGSLIILSLVLAPTNNQLQTGSTYSRAPEGYAAWYAYLQEQGAPLQRWERPLSGLGLTSDSFTPFAEEEEPDADAPVPDIANPKVLVRVFPSLAPSSIADTAWVELGNVLVLVGIDTPIADTDFLSILDSPQGAVKVETRRRRFLRSENLRLLEDAAGAVAWEESIGNGKVIYVGPPFLAANAYFSEPGNIPFLANLVMEPQLPIYIDEYLHGYRDRETEAEETQDTLLNYLSRTPVLLVLVQAVVLVVLMVWGDRRLGPPIKIEIPKQNSSEAYIQALGSVLHKAESSEFVVETIGKAERERIQRSLGLGAAPVDLNMLLTTWKSQTGKPTTDLKAVLSRLQKNHRLSERELLIWLGKLQQLRRDLP
ncbi:DUF4350 domain-containing protein [Vacuolonema iberomarrocanum]|uniref:DUF4350 domain-containing protein n=1 Tax=Vacuolonema iberomarrocanum TaxID=3454632 RepID=UPI001A0F8890|nr:DUF4350 domain-containing protein [filamentous cyanobacterium LEGE 07170]